MNLSHKETDLIFSIMRDLSGALGHAEIRRRVGQKMLDLLQADHFVSYVWDEEAQRFGSRVQINMTDDNLDRYEKYFRFCDPIIDVLQRRKKATLVSEVMRHDKLVRTEFYNDFLKPDGLCFGLNFHAYDRGDNIGDLRIWRGAEKEDFTARDSQIVNAVGPSLVNALIRAHSTADRPAMNRFAEISENLGFTLREVEVADLLVTGLSDNEICVKLGFSKPTLRSHIGAIFRKTGINRRTQLALILTGKNHHL